MAASRDEHPWHKGEPCILGIDEAGRGPVLGPMVYTAAYCAKSSIKALNGLGADDSKQLSEEQRDKLRKKIDRAPFLRTTTRVLTADELSKKMLRKSKYNLNLISHDTALALVETAIGEGVDVAEIYVDTVGDPGRYAAKFRDRFPHVGKVVVAKKADATYRIVGAASIVAKTTRDKHIREWTFPEEDRSTNFAEGGTNTPVRFTEARGSGYPSDPATKIWMERSCDEVFGFPTLVRFSWGTTRVLLEKKAVAVDWESDDEEGQQNDEKPAVKTKNIKSFFAAKNNSDTVSAKRRKLASKIVVLPRILSSKSLQRTEKLL